MIFTPFVLYSVPKFDGQARRDNLADVSAKDGSQETLVNLGSLFVSLIVLPLLDDQFLLIWLLYFLCTFVHLLSNYRAVRSLRLDTLNQSRLVICVRSDFSIF